eukprot:CAMPEP_0178636106 /NCGR_PEP_ID=MMETSP0698-20121128/13550_1 /TAXON_ID=265572 /ORGANISM="Extubocellulus spinifer, Strain CCMP396" /LENGTH=63 /DNA_ID=CAMNT_0020275945 /DNA_START=29 /DNA_END=221 /DNA_ORIENTATION=+
MTKKCFLGRDSLPEGTKRMADDAGDGADAPGGDCGEIDGGCRQEFEQLYGNEESEDEKWTEGD